MYVEGGNISYSHSDIPTLLGKREVGQMPRGRTKG